MAEPIDPSRHVVQFYDSEDDLTPSVGSYLAEAVRLGGSAAVFSGARVRRGLARALAQRGIDVADARRRGVLVERDAQRTLSRVAGAERLDPVAFGEVIGQAVRDTRRSGRGLLRVYGDMVAVLWRRGHIGRALALEGLWNDLAVVEPFSLYCAYPKPALARWPHALRHLTELHSAIHGPPFPRAMRWLNPAPEVVRFFDDDRRSAAAARQQVRQVLDSWNEAQFADDAALVVSELVANVVRHAGAGFHVALSRTPSGIRISVTDSDPQPPVPRTASPNASGGRGLTLIQHVSSRWGFTPAPTGKSVWAELARPANA